MYDRAMKEKEVQEKQAKLKEIEDKNKVEEEKKRKKIEEENEQALIRKKLEEEEMRKKEAREAKRLQILTQPSSLIHKLMQVMKSRHGDPIESNHLESLSTMNDSASELLIGKPIVNILESVSIKDRSLTLLKKTTDQILKLIDSLPGNDEDGLDERLLSLKSNVSFPSLSNTRNSLLLRVRSEMESSEKLESEMKGHQERLSVFLSSIEGLLIHFGSDTSISESSNINHSLKSLTNILNKINNWKKQRNDSIQQWSDATDESARKLLEAHSAISSLYSLLTSKPSHDTLNTIEVVDVNVYSLAEKHLSDLEAEEEQIRLINHRASESFPKNELITALLGVRGAVKSRLSSIESSLNTLKTGVILNKCLDGLDLNKGVEESVAFISFNDASHNVHKSELMIAEARVLKGTAKTKKESEGKALLVQAKDDLEKRTRRVAELADIAFPELFYLVPESDLRVVVESKGRVLTQRSLKVLPIEEFIINYF